MYDTLKSETYEDFRQRYQGCYGWLCYGGNETMVVILSVKKDRVNFSTKESNDYFAFADQDVQFKFLPIRRGWYNTLQGPVLLERIPARQYSRGISTSNTSCKSFAFGNTLKPRNLSLEVLEDVFTEEKQKLNYKKIGVCVLNKFFCFGALLPREARALFFLDALVGSEKNGVVTFDKPWQHIKQEFQDMVVRQGLSHEITEIK